MKHLMGVCVAAAAAAFGRELVAQEGDFPPKNPAKLPETTEKPVLVRRFFDRPIDYWGRGLDFGDESTGTEKDPKRPEAGPAQKAPTSEWGQVVKLPDGTLSYHELPQPLVDVLENPSPENIRAYFAFRMSRTQKILRAAELMKEYRASALGQPEESRAPSPLSSPVDPKAAGRPEEKPPAPVPPKQPRNQSPFTVTYFHKQHCPHCDSQDVILAEWLKDKPEAKLEVIEFGMLPELWRAYQVRGTPTLLIQDSTSKEIMFLEGLSRVEVLERTLRECRSKGREEAAVNGTVQK